jgi:hypothetical protein
MRETSVRYYVDADILGLAHVLAPLRGDITYPGDPGAVINKRQRPPCPITTTATPDTDWLPIVAAQGWLIISRDHNIRENIAERHAVRDSGAKMVALAGQDARTKWGQLELVMRRWSRIEDLSEQPGPFIYLASRTAMTSLSLDG